MSLLHYTVTGHFIRIKKYLTQIANEPIVVHLGTWMLLNLSMRMKIWVEDGIVVGGRRAGTSISQTASAEEKASLTSGVRGQNWQTGWRPWEGNGHSNEPLLLCVYVGRIQTHHTSNLQDFQCFHNNKKHKVAHSHLKIYLLIPNLHGRNY